MVATKVASTITDHHIIPENRDTEIHIPTQPNGTNHEYYVMHTIWIFVEEFVHGLRYLNFKSSYNFSFCIVILDCWFL